MPKSVRNTFDGVMKGLVGNNRSGLIQEKVNPSNAEATFVFKRTRMQRFLKTI